uniref:eS28 SCC n=1 Tax=Spraguea lophii (strain 42_110) TaxID=1358809 RepID=UPI0022656F9E|nr:Chain SCC, eS28 SCC [Spraguea lophii 42_110]7QJH_RCC Chain RCC, eS28 [Spraguea lophii 42_110]7QJH_SCC Chain SCC, eS28 [Spraguea lophii 42_110]8BR3_SCC Chain SCC, eS28 [Spraguea lophii 42_110]8P5D_SCC Chain SCC, eS28 [Spraguea lophii 42_110]8P60_RCC Chain RCC, 40S ribosomal protein S28 [Spraguea lophii 42_110]8P60_SCC Chain SCC, 40S ribosomal protein S28 [Spraguea lophii 42_110]
MSEEVYIGEVLQTLEKTGPGGGLTMCQVQLKDQKRTLYRAIMGPIAVGDLVALLDCEREHRRGRF